MVLYKYILRSHLVPFLFANITLFFIFILQFMMKFADRLVGKGLDTFVIIKLIVFNLAWMVVLVVPMAVLVAALMAYGTMSQNNEITIMKSSGISLYRMMAAPLAVSVLVGYLLLLFNDDVLPDANHQAKVLMSDISMQKPTLSLEPGVFSQEVPNYAILARGIDPNSNMLREVTIYDYTNPQQINLVTAEKGRIYFSKDQSKLLMDLQNGEIHESDIQQTGLYRKLVFVKHRIAMPADQFSFQQSAPGIQQRGERELAIADMEYIVDSIRVDRARYQGILEKEVNRYMLADSSYNNPNTVQPGTVMQPQMILSRAIDKVKTAKNIIISNLNRVEFARSEENKYLVEIHKKYALPVACIVFVLIGAPLGVMVKKGGFGVAASISLLFFVIYWAFLIGGEKLAERNFFEPWIGMWAANIILAAAGVVLTMRTVKETVTINFSGLKRFLPRQWREIEEIEESSADENY